MSSGQASEQQASRRASNRGNGKWASRQASERASEWESGRMSGRVREWAREWAREWESGWRSERAGLWASGRDKGGKRGERGEQQQFFFSVHHHPNFYDFFLRAIAPFAGISPSFSVENVCQSVWSSLWQTSTLWRVAINRLCLRQLFLRGVLPQCPGCAILQAYTE